MQGAPLPAVPPLAAPIHPAGAPKRRRRRPLAAPIPPADAPTTKRIRLRCKSRDAVALPMMHTRVETQDSVSDGRAEPGVWPQRDKITEWYAHPASLLEEFPLSGDAIECRKAHPVIEGSPSIRHVRNLMRTLDVTVGHSFAYKGKWHSLRACHLATFYEDRALHMVGERRIQDWWAAQPLSDRSETRTGAALTFWFSLNDAPRLPDAIEVGLTSTVLAEFEAVFLLAYQRFSNVPEHIRVIDGNKVMPEKQFRAILASNTKTCGFVAVLSEWLKFSAAESLEDLAPFTAITTFDGDSLWQRRAAPRTFCGHAAGTLEHNPVSFENKNKPRRLIKLSYLYCMRPRDYLKIATPLRWPRGSPPLRSLVRRIAPFVRFESWAGGTSYESVMNAIWDTYVCWGLRAAFNDPQVHTPVPWFARDKPLKAGTANNPRWGVGAITANPAVLCVNAMWQTSASAAGPKARSRMAWLPGSAVEALVAHTIAMCKSRPDFGVRSGAGWMASESMGVFREIAKADGFFTFEEEDVHVQVFVN